MIPNPGSKEAIEMTDEYICKDCGHRAGDHAVNNRCLDCDCVADPYLEQLVALRAELVELKSAHDNLARQLGATNDDVEIAVEALVQAKNDIEIYNISRLSHHSIDEAYDVIITALAEIEGSD
jgi:hypothetical protein